MECILFLEFRDKKVGQIISLNEKCDPFLQFESGELNGAETPDVADT